MNNRFHVSTVGPRPTDDEPSTFHTMALRLSGSEVNARNFTQTRVIQYTRHGNSTTTQHEMYRDGKAISLTERKKDENSEPDSY